MEPLEATYDSLEAVPEWARPLYISLGGKWVFNGDKVKGLAEQLNPALDAKKNEILTEKKNLQTKYDATIQERDTALRELTTYKTPGSKVLNSDEAKSYEMYTNLGPVKDLEKLKTDYTTVNGKLNEIQVNGKRKTAADEAKANYEVLQDILSSEPGKKVSDIFTKKVKVKDERTKEETEQVKLFFNVDVEENGNKKTVEKSLEDFIKDEKIPEYKVEALFKEAAAPGTLEPPKKFGNRLQLPRSSAKKSGEDDNGGGEKKKVQVFNDQRSTRRLPWETAEPAQK